MSPRLLVLALVAMAAPAFAQAPTFDPALIPTDGHPGFSEARIRTPASPPDPYDGSGAFRLVCEFSHMNQDDPIVFPGQQGAAHLHSYFGNKLTNFASTRRSIAQTGASTCQGGILNRSAYWVPSMIDTRMGRPIKPAAAIIYYKSGYHSAPLANIQPLPAGLRMLAGNPAATGPNLDPSYFPSRNYFFACDFPDGGGPGPDHDPREVPNCPAGSFVVMGVTFPQCWNGRDLDSPDHRSHMSFRVGEGVCPSTHPVMISEIGINVNWPVTAADSPPHWRLASDGYANTLPAGYSAHADWFNGWRPAIAERWNKNCLQAARDCHVGLLGVRLDGRGVPAQLY